MLMLIRRDGLKKECRQQGTGQTFVRQKLKPPSQHETGLLYAALSEG